MDIKYSEENLLNHKYPIDVLFASNMISVGLDVSRLNSMLIVQQPKTTSEYIQATSRVGRTNPGFVFTLYNPSKSRDISYFEKFSNYHNAFYKYVEPTSVTSFSEPVVDRALHAVIIALIRHSIDENSNINANCIRDVDEDSRHIKEAILKRVEYISNNNIEVCNYVNNTIDKVFKNWNSLLEKASYDEIDLVYGGLGKKSKANEVPLLVTFDEKHSSSFPTLTSMRNVAPNLGIDIYSIYSEREEI